MGEGVCLLTPAPIAPPMHDVRVLSEDAPMGETMVDSDTQLDAETELDSDSSA